MEKTINKIMMVGFVCGAFLVGYTVQVLNTLLSSSWGTYARVTDSELITYGAPVVVGFVFFLYVSFNKNIRDWAQEVIVEVSKVVWPSQKDTTAMTIFVCIFMILSGILLGMFDWVSGELIKFIISNS